MAVRNEIVRAAGESVFTKPHLSRSNGWMTALYMVAASENWLVAGTGNRRRPMGYFTNGVIVPATLRHSRSYGFRDLRLLRYLRVPENILNKARLPVCMTDKLMKGDGCYLPDIDNFLLTNTGHARDRISGKCIQPLHINANAYNILSTS